MPFRLAHFSDLHFTLAPEEIPWKELRTKRAVGGRNLKFFGRRGCFSDAARIVKAFAEDLKAQKPDHILFTGDATGLSMPLEFDRALTALEPLQAIAPCTGIPGNHDFYVAEAERLGYFSKWFGAWEASDLDRQPAGAPYPLVRFLGGDHALICLRDARAAALWDSSGRVGAEQIKAFDALCSQPRVRPRVKILAIHYAFRRRDGTPDAFFHRLRDGKAVLETAVKHGIRCILHGHIHHRYVHLAGAGLPITTANPGSLTFNGREHSYHLYTLDAESISCTARRFNPRRRRFEAWPEAPQSGRIA